MQQRHEPADGWGEDGGTMDVMEIGRYWQPLRRRAWLAALCAVVGLGLAFGGVHLRPPAYQASALIRLRLLADTRDPTTLELLSETLLYTEARAALSPAVLQLASQATGATQHTLAAALTAQPLVDSDLVQITARAARADTAARLANADANALLRYEAGAIQQQEASAEQPLRTQLAASAATIASLQGQIGALQQEGIAASDPRMTAAQAQLQAALATQQSQQAALAQLQQSEAQLEPQLTLQQPADAAGAARIPSERDVLLGGLVAGLTVGILLVYLLALRERRLGTVWWRADAAPADAVALAAPSAPAAP